MGNELKGRFKQLGFIAEIFNSRNKMIAKLPPDFDKAYQYRHMAEAAAERQMMELGKTKKYAGHYLRSRVRYVDIHHMPHLLR